jgi:hypothetical protein
MVENTDERRDLGEILCVELYEKPIESIAWSLEMTEEKDLSAQRKIGC